LAGIDVVVATPKGFEPDLEVVATAAALAQRGGSTVELSHDPVEAVTDADAVYTDVWVSMGDDDDERAARSEAFTPFQVDDRIMAEAGNDAVFMHCLPAHRGQEVAPEVIDGPQSVVLDEAENRMHTAQALLIALVDGRLEGAGAPWARM
jgi:ornithine carbamoyltransferase